MGQRQQIYLALPFQVELPDKTKSNVIGLHNQWLYGYTSLSQLKNALSFIKNQDNYGPMRCETFKDEAVDAFRAIYSTNANGYYHYHHVLGHKECSNPDNGDNNDGIVVIDARDINNLKYCYMWLSQRDYSNAKTYTPISCFEYIKNYYGDEWLGGTLKMARKRLEQDNTLTEKEKVKKLEEEAKACVDHQTDCINLCTDIENLASLLSPSEVSSIFPTWIEVGR